MKMQNNDPNSSEVVTWLVVGFLACWGGLVRYLIDIKQSRAVWSWANAAAQIVVSGFAGVMMGLVTMQSGASLYWTWAGAGVSGAMGSIAITYLWGRVSGDGSSKT